MKKRLFLLTIIFSLMIGGLGLYKTSNTCNAIVSDNIEALTWFDWLQELFGNNKSWHYVTVYNKDPYNNPNNANWYYMTHADMDQSHVHENPNNYDDTGAHLYKYDGEHSVYLCYSNKMKVTTPKNEYCYAWY